MENTKKQISRTEILRQAIEIRNQLTDTQAMIWKCKSGLDVTTQGKQIAELNVIGMKFNKILLNLANIINNI